MTGSEKGEGKQFRISIRWKVLIGFSVLFSLIYLLALNLFTNLSVNAADNQVQQDLTQALVGIAETVDVDMLMDLVANGEPNDEGFSDDPRFVELLDFLEQAQNIEPDAWPYLYVASENENEIYFVVDVWARSDDPGNAGGFMEPYTSNSGWIVAGLSDQVYRAVDHRVVQDIKTYAESIEETRPKLAASLDNFGTWLTEKGIFPKKDFGTYCDKFDCWASGYMPLEDSSGEKVAAVGVDFQADYLLDIRNAVRTQVRNAFLYSYPVMIVLMVLVTTLFTRPLLRLSENADKIAEGDYEVDLSSLTEGRFPDEINTLAKVFETMVGKVYQRELSLRREVAKLRIEIDQTKKHVEVSQIVESDFFKDLQSRASDLRSRRSKTED
jgi:hypothetical protein